MSTTTATTGVVARLSAPLRLLTLLIAATLAMVAFAPHASAAPATGADTTQVEAADGTYTVAYDVDARTAAVTAPDGTTTYIGPDDTEVWEAADSGLSSNNVSNPQNTTQGKYTTACTWGLWAIGVIHSAGWAGLIAAAAINPALGFIILMGQSAFFTWVSTKC